MSDCEFDIQEEEIFQKKNHSFYESNNAENKTGWLPIIDELDKTKQIWDLLILIMAIFNSFAVPLEYVISELPEVPAYQTLDLIINILFIFDIVIGFRTTYFDSLGNEIRSPKLIAKKYIGGMFFVDLFSSIPYRYAKLIFPPIESISFLKILKIARISRFGPFVQRLELNAEDKAVSIKTLEPAINRFKF